MIDTALLPLNDEPSTVRKAAPVDGDPKSAYSVAECIVDPAGMAVKLKVCVDDAVDGVVETYDGGGIGLLLTVHVLFRLKLATVDV